MKKPLAVFCAILSLCAMARAEFILPGAVPGVQESVPILNAVPENNSAPVVEASVAPEGDTTPGIIVFNPTESDSAPGVDVAESDTKPGIIVFNATESNSAPAVTENDSGARSAISSIAVPTVQDSALPDINAPSVVLMEKETGTILFAKDEHTQREPASVTKIMTILLTMEAIDNGTLSYDSIVTASAHASSMGGSQIWLRENEQMTVEEMLKAVCVVSANDCAVALGEHLAGSEEAFVERMNRRAKELGMEDTVFQNATGLPAVGHVTSAYDIALMSRELILHHPDIRKFTTIWMDSLRGGTSVLVNTNKLLRTFDGATGLKTGSTGSARYCLSATAERDGMELIAVILKGETSQKRFQDAQTLLNYGFSRYALRSVEPETPLPPVPVELGAADSVEVVPDGSCLLLLEKEKAVLLRQEVTLEETLKAPVERGTRVGTLTAYAGDEPLAEIPLLTASDVPRVTYGQMFLRLLRTAFLDEA